jgi:hypothetical protein
MGTGSRGKGKGSRNVFNKSRSKYLTLDFCLLTQDSGSSGLWPLAPGRLTLDPLFIGGSS